MHAVCGYPVKSTWLKAIKAGNFVGWPLLTEKNVAKYYPETDETPKGHLNQTRKNVRSTKHQAAPFQQANSASLRGKKVQDIYTSVYNVRETIFSDQTGQFPTRSSRGNKYVMVMVEVDSNAILLEPMHSRKDNEMIRAYDSLVKRLLRAGVTPRKHVLDNEISLNMKDHIRDTYKFEVELVPPGCHRRNAAEVAIRNFKSHFLSVLAGVAPTFPPSLWDRLLPQTEITLNLLRQSNATPTVSAYAHLCGPFNYNKMPLAPMGCEVQVHEKTNKRGTWASHSIDGWYLNTSADHYRVHNCHIKSTKAERLSDTVQFKHKDITNPSLSPNDKLMQALAHCKTALKQLSHSPADDQARELQELIAATQAHLSPAPAPPTPVPRVPIFPSTPSRPTVPPIHRELPNHNHTNTPGPRVLPSTSPPHRPDIARRAQARRRRIHETCGPVFNPNQPPALSTRSRVRTSRIPPPTPTATRATRLNTSRIPRRPTTRSRPQANAATDLKAGRFPVAFRKLEHLVHQALAVLDVDSGKKLNHRQLLKHPRYKDAWSRSAADEFGRLAQGVGNRVKGTNTIQFIHEADIPRHRKKDVTYGSFVCTVRPEKADPNRTRFVAGGDKCNYPYEVATPTAEMLVAKIFFNSVISTPGARFMTMDISNFYLMTPLLRPEYIRIKLSDLPDEIIREYNLTDKANKHGMIFVSVTRGMYGLPQSGLLANQLLETRLNQHGYFQSKLVPGLWRHTSRPIQFVLTVDDFGVKYVGREHAEHLYQALCQHYKVTTDWSGDRYIGIHLRWDYVKHQVHLFMPGYVQKALTIFRHNATHRQNQPFPHTPIKYGARKQYAKGPSTSPKLDKKDKRFIQQVCGKFLFYGRAVDSTVLTPLSAIASQSAAPTKETMAQTKQLMDYLASQEEAVLTYNRSQMILAVHSDASYLNEPQARSRAGGHFFLSHNENVPRNNGAILNIAHIIKHVMSSATEAELAALYIMAREAVYIRIILQEMGHKQPPTPIQTDNAMADAVINGKVQPKRTKAMDMRFHWLRDRECQDQFKFYWRPGKTNYADYWTKHHSATHHVNIRKEFLTPYIALEMLQQRQNAMKPAAAAA
eukprot:CCRYP_014880-RH/>CCRYP_014880-RH protein AED:0.12 eAED:0.12 QI:0/-1/0/1/-1/1/1/0/1096